MSPRQSWLDTIKISDDPGKAMGTERALKLAFDTLNIKPE